MAFGKHSEPTLQEALTFLGERDDRIVEVLTGDPEARAAGVLYLIADSVFANDRVAKAVRNNEILIHPAYQEPPDGR
jgi:hypothetical protein